jgi:hypothetical protein
VVDLSLIRGSLEFVTVFFDACAEFARCKAFSLARLFQEYRVIPWRTAGSIHGSDHFGRTATEDLAPRGSALS